MLCNAGESKSIFVDVQDPCLQPPKCGYLLCYVAVRVLHISAFILSLF